MRRSQKKASRRFLHPTARNPTPRNQGALCTTNEARRRVTGRGSIIARDAPAPRRLSTAARAATAPAHATSIDTFLARREPCRQPALLHFRDRHACRLRADVDRARGASARIEHRHRD
jgi:hypothetical protein